MRFRVSSLSTRLKVRGLREKVKRKEGKEGKEGLVGEKEEGRKRQIREGMKRKRGEKGREGGKEEEKGKKEERRFCTDRARARSLVGEPWAHFSDNCPKLIDNCPKLIYKTFIR